MIDALTLVGQLTVLVLGGARITILLVDDKILDFPRGWLAAKLRNRPYLSTLLECYRCLSFWVAVVLTVAWWNAPVGTTIVLLPFAGGMLMMLLAALFYVIEDADE